MAIYRGLDGREFDAIFAGIALICGKFICISLLECKMFARLTSVSIRNAQAILVP
jgi:hypothetical protein